MGKKRNSSLNSNEEREQTLNQLLTEILKDNENKLHELANYLFEKETISGEQFMEILQA